MQWPANPFWDYCLDLYGRPAVEAACLELQRRHGLDVNLVLFCCWLGHRGIEVDDPLLAAARRAAEGWQIEVVRPLRSARRRLKATLANPAADSIQERWPELVSQLRERVLELEIDAERLAQLNLAELNLAQLNLAKVGEDAAATHRAGVRLASANLRRYWSFGAQDRHALQSLLAAAFPAATELEMRASFSWVDD